MDVAPADEHAHRALPPAPARRRGDARLDLPAAHIDAARTADYIANHPTPARCSTRSGSSRSTPRRGSPRSTCCCSSRWSAVCCPAAVHWNPVRSAPPKAPRRLDRLAAHRDGRGRRLARRGPRAARPPCGAAVPRARARRHDAVGEKGYLKETGNLVFHLALIGVLIGVALGHLLGWKGDVIVPVGETFANTLSRYDTFSPGPWVDPDDLEPFALALDQLDASSRPRPGRGQFGPPRDFTAHTTFTDADGRASSASIRVNHPLETGRRGLPPRQRLRPGSRCATREGTVFYRDRRRSCPGQQLQVGRRREGARRHAAAARLLRPVPADRRHRRGAGAPLDLPRRPQPRARADRLRGRALPRRAAAVGLLPRHRGDEPVKGANGTTAAHLAKPGQTFELPDGRGTITFDGVERFAGLSVRPDPGKRHPRAALPALAGLIASLVVRRRRIFVRVSPGGAGRTVVSVGGLAKDDDDGMGDEVAGVLTHSKERDDERDPGPARQPGLYSAMASSRSRWSLRRLPRRAGARAGPARAVPASDRSSSAPAAGRAPAPAPAAPRPPASADAGARGAPAAPARPPASRGPHLLGTLLIVRLSCAGRRVHRWPLGNMFEFAVVGACSSSRSTSGSTRRDLRWLGLFVVGPVLLILGLAITVWYTEASELMPSLR